ncbi:hypothetical protein GGR27_001538 [Lewinella antarctica]|uniref:HEAT repeat domain-containing protein n=1 Tax=Neolewinella antarctica TaxID=442734 RepID=A0ABX0XAS4_9BACT|nr:hypothetical protein [Neolewinella antarctica]
MAAENVRPLVNKEGDINIWTGKFHRTFRDHATHWYHVAHVLAQIIEEFAAPRINWSNVVYQLQVGGPFFEEIIILILDHVEDSALRARLLNALLFFPTDRVREVARRLLLSIEMNNWVGTLSLVRTLGHFEFPEAIAFRKEYARVCERKFPKDFPTTGLPGGGARTLAGAWRELRASGHTSQASVRYLLRRDDVPVETLVAACHECDDWVELHGRFRQDFLAAGYTGPLVPTLDEYVRQNLDRNTWPTGETSHRRHVSEVNYALFNQPLLPATIVLLAERLADASEFRSTCAALHLAAYTQLPRLLTDRRPGGGYRSYFAQPAARRGALPEVIVDRLIEMTERENSVSIFNFAAVALSNLATDDAHGTRITEHWLDLARTSHEPGIYVFACYQLLPGFHHNPRRESIRALLPGAIARLTEHNANNFGRRLCQLYDRDLTLALLAKIAPWQTEEAYSTFEELAMSVVLLRDDYHRLPLPVYHPAAGKR